MILAALALLAATPAPQPGAITITYGMWGAITTIRIAPGGVLTVRRTGAQPENRRMETGPGGYRRIATLVDPARKWSGANMPCDVHAQGRTPALVHWDADGASVRVPLNCMSGPADQEIQFVRTAIDEVKTWARDAPTDRTNPKTHED
jgi:hypothetical protein